MILIYNLGVRLYFLLISVSALFNKKARQFTSGRKGVFDKLKAFSESSHSPIVWFHAASLGEFEQGLPVIEAYKAAFPEEQILVTFFSPSGYELRKDHPVADFTSYLPVDTRANAKKFVEIVKPSKVFFIKYEYWFHHLKAIHQDGIPLFSISALFTEKHIFFKPYGGFHREILSFFDHTFVQNQSSLDLLQSIGIQNASISGDTRFDRVSQTIEKPNDYPEIEAFKGTNKVFIMGSAWPSDMQMIADFINNTSSRTKFIIAPHLVDDSNVKKISIGLQKQIHRYSQGKQIPEQTEVLILDTIGMLSSVYQYGDFAYIGGAFGDGLHNILEAVAFGLPVVYGNKGLEKFPESIELESLGGGFSISNASQASEVLNRLNNNEDFRRNASQVCKDYISTNKGATDRIMKYLKSNK